jgi:hypothetical protein
MCRGGKDGVIRRCNPNKAQHDAALLRKKVKYRADRDGVTVDEWKTNNPQALAALSGKSSFIKQVPFQNIDEPRQLADDIPAQLPEHMKQSTADIDVRLSADEKKALVGYTACSDACNMILLGSAAPDDIYYDTAPPWRETSYGPTNFATASDLKDYLNTMDKALSSRQPESRVLYRGMPIYSSLQKEIGELIGKEIDVNDTDTMLEGLREYYKPGKIFDYSTYVSTTHSAYYAAERTENTSGTNISYWDNPAIKGIMIEMKTNAGLDVTGIARHNAYEREVVLPRDTRFKVVAIHTAPESYSTVGGYDEPEFDEDIEEETYKKIAIVVQMAEVDKDGNEITHSNPHRPEPVSDSILGAVKV